MDDRYLAARFRKLTRSAKWELKHKIDLQFNNCHSQGMVRIGDLFYLSAVELLEKPTAFGHLEQGYDRTPGKGIGRLFAFDRQGKLAKQAMLGEGTVYHPGGIDFDGKHIWVPVAEYRPGGPSIVYKVDPATMAAEPAFRFHDHIGGLACDVPKGELIGYSWGSRTFYKWTPDGRQLLAKQNTSHFVDYQDGHYIGGGAMISSGISELPHPARSDSRPYELGGLALIDTDTLETIHEVPVTEFSPQGHVITRNPVFVENAGTELRLYAVPDDDRGSLLIYETTTLMER